ncbi:MAG: universal stress protein [Rhodothermaceae bacterium]|nr:universal stress protein [Rhodothermaceae bacterium]
MTKRILVVLDPDHDTPIATRYAVEIAKAHDGAVTGLALVDRKRINEAAAGGGIGAMYYAEKLRRDLADEVRSEAQTLLQEFIAQVEAAGAQHTDDHVADDDVVQSIAEDMKTHDLLVAGHESHFYYANPEKRTHVLAKLVEDSAAATLVIREAYRPISKVLLAYDGRSAAARAMQKFVHLAPFGTDLDVEVLHVHGGGREAQLESEQRLRAAQSYLQAYDFKAVTMASVEDSAPRERILSHTVASGADLIVAGAFSQTGLKKFFFGSTAKGLIEESPVPLFLYH